TTGEQRWTREIGLGLYVRPMVADGVVYVGGARVYALDAATGEQRWISETSGPYVSVTPVGGVVYVRDVEGDMRALDAVTGERRWTYEVSDGDYYPDDSVVAEGVVYLDDDGESVVRALDAATGERRWTYETGGGIHRPVVADGVVYISTGGDKLHAVRAATG
ncbi:PQQ-binding-like beta-propeller repeat protein, partial [Streptosporangium sp. NPDC020145]